MGNVEKSYISNKRSIDVACVMEYFSSEILHLLQ